MKATNITLIIQAVLMYLMQLPLTIILILIRFPINDDILSKAVGVLFVIALVLSIVAFPICIVNAVFSIISIFKGEHNPSKVSMIVKFALIPWYILNFIICVCLLAGFLNPWLFLAVPIVACFLILFTYAYMISTGLPDVAYFINRLIKKKLKVNFPIILSIVFLFIFCLDIVGGLLFFIQTKKQIK